jgi:nucleoside-diphosphate-sugar epimerase
MAPFSEEHRTNRPTSLYATTKRADEAIVHVYNHIYGLSITGLRFFTVYGTWGRGRRGVESARRAAAGLEAIRSGPPATTTRRRGASQGEKSEAPAATTWSCGR